MGRYFGREPRYSREELERQAQEAIEARVSLGRPPDEDFLPLEVRLDELDVAIVARPPVEPVPEPQPARAQAAQSPAATRRARRRVPAEQTTN